MPYDSATQSGVTILSYAYATPVIAYDIGSLSEYIKHERNGFIVNYQDNSSIIGLLAQVTNEEILKMSQECIDIFRNLYSKNACQKQYHAYYQNLIGERK